METLRLKKNRKREIPQDLLYGSVISEEITVRMHNFLHFLLCPNINLCSSLIQVAVRFLEGCGRRTRTSVERLMRPCWNLSSLPRNVYLSSLLSKTNGKLYFNVTRTGLDLNQRTSQIFIFNKKMVSQKVNCCMFSYCKYTNKYYKSQIN